MLIPLDTLQNYAHGTFSSSIENGAWHPRRIPESLRPHYSDTPASLGRMECPAGVRLRFETDARQVKTKLRYGGAARLIYKSTLICNGEVHSVFGPDERSDNWEGVIFDQVQRKRCVIDWWLPNMSRADIVSLEIDDSASIKTAPPLPLRWLVYGASITQGMVSSAPHLNFVARCALKLNAEVFNLGIGGAKLDLTLSENLPPGNFDLVTISYGTNDFMTNIPVETHAANGNALIRALRAQYKCPVVLITIPTWHGRTEPNELGKTLDDYRQAFAPIKREFEHVSLAAGDAMIPDEEKFFVDNVHPNDVGFAHYADNLLPILGRALS